MALLARDRRWGAGTGPWEAHLVRGWATGGAVAMPGVKRGDFGESPRACQGAGKGGKAAVWVRGPRGASCALAVTPAPTWAAGGAGNAGDKWMCHVSTFKCDKAHLSRACEAGLADDRCPTRR